MGRKPAPAVRKLQHKITTYVNGQKYEELTAILARNPRKDMSTLVRDILHNREVKVFVKDQTMDNVMEELAKLRTEIRAIGVNINQITRLFNTYPEPQKKTAYAKMAFEEHRALQPKIERLLSIISQLAEKWLSD